MTYAPETSPGHAAGVAALIGTRRLAEYSNWDSRGSLVRAFGPDPIGYIFFDQTGHFSVHIMRTPPVPPFAAGPENPTPSEAHELLQSYYGAFGTYDVDTAQSMIVFHVEGATRPDFIGTDVRFPYRLAEDSLIIGDEKTWRRIWVRAPEAARGSHDAA